MSDELTDLRARLEALAAEWCKRSPKYESESGWEKGYGEAGRAHAKQLRALLAPHASVRCPDCGSDPVPSDKACPVCDRPAPVAEPPKCEECVFVLGECELPGCPTGGKMCSHIKRDYDHCRSGRGNDGNCGPSGRLFKARGKV